MGIIRDTLHIADFADKLKLEIKSGRFKKDKEAIARTKTQIERIKHENKKLGWEIRKLKEIRDNPYEGMIEREDAGKRVNELTTKKKDIKWWNNYLNMQKGEKFYFYIDNRFGYQLWGSKRHKYRISNETILKYSSERIEKLITNRILKGLKYEYETEERPKSKDALLKLKKSVEDWIDGKEPEYPILIDIDYVTGEITTHVQGKKK